VGGGRKREGVATTVTDSRSVIHHPRPRPGVGVGLVGFYDIPRDTSGDSDDVPTGDNVAPPSDDGRRPDAGPDTQTNQKERTTPLHHNYPKTLGTK